MMTCASGRVALSARSVAMPSRPGIITSSSTTSGDLALLHRGEQLVAARVAARVVAAQRQEGPQIRRKGRVVVHDGDVRLRHGVSEAESRVLGPPDGRSSEMVNGSAARPFKTRTSSELMRTPRKSTKMLGFCRIVQCSWSARRPV